MNIDTNEIKKLIKSEKLVMPKSFKITEFYQGYIAGMDIIEEFIDLYEDKEGKEIAEYYNVPPTPLKTPKKAIGEGV